MGKTEDIPAITTALNKWGAVRSRIEEYQDEKLAQETTADIPHHTECVHRRWHLEPEKNAEAYHRSTRA